MNSSHTPISPAPRGFVDAVPRGLRRLEHVMGMPVIIEVCDPGVGPEAVERAIDWLHRVDAMFSTYRRDSEISRLNHGELGPAAIHPDVTQVLVRCEELRHATDGYFDITAPYAPGGLGPEPGRGGPGSIDPSGFVKGWAVERAAWILLDAGAENFAVNAGGDLVAHGRPDGDSRWRVGIQHPRSARDIAITLAVSDAAIATSATYVRGEHVRDPHATAAPAGLLSVTITGPELPTADAYATAAFAMGARRGAAWCARLTGGYDAILICDDDTVLTHARHQPAARLSSELRPVEDSSPGERVRTGVCVRMLAGGASQRLGIRPAALATRRTSSQPSGAGRPPGQRNGARGCPVAPLLASAITTPDRHARRLGSRTSDHCKTIDFFVKSSRLRLRPSSLQEPGTR